LFAGRDNRLPGFNPDAEDAPGAMMMPTPAEPGRHVELVFIGHVGRATDRTPAGPAFSYVGGSGFATAFAAAALLGSGAGLAAQVGDDFDLNELPGSGLGSGLSSGSGSGLDLDGVVRLAGPSARFVIEQLPGGRLRFDSEPGVAAEPRFDLFPVGYLDARHVHLGTAPPGQQGDWLKFLRDKGFRGRVSVDMFEPFVEADPDACRRLCDRADLVFMNEAEYLGLFGGTSQLPVPAIVKYGAGGAELLGAAPVPRVSAPWIDEVDPIGAGEILAGVFLALRMLGLADAAALARAVRVASVSVTEFGVAGDSVREELARLRKELGAVR
jgi:sugar/nucleoside kinase (ribokinase family)